MNRENSRVIRQPEHTARAQTTGLFFQRELAITSPRKPDRRHDRDPKERDVLAEPFSHDNKHLGDLLSQEAHVGHFDACQRESPIMDKASQDLANFASLPIYEELNWNKVSRPGTLLRPPLSPIQNPLTERQFTSHLSNWLVDGVYTSPNTSPSQMPLQHGKDSHLLRSGFTKLEIQKKYIGRSSHESLEFDQPLATSTQHGLLPIELMQDLLLQRDDAGELPADEDLLGPFDLSDFIPNDYVPLRLPSHRGSKISTRNNTTSSVVGDNLFAIGLQEAPAPLSAPMLSEYKRREPVRGSRLSSGLQYAKVVDSCQFSLPSTEQRSGDAVTPSGPMLSTPQFISEQAPFSQDEDDECNWFLRAGQIYMAYLWQQDSAGATPDVGSALPYTEEDYIWARNRVPADVKQWLRATNKKRSSSTGLPSTPNDTLPSCATTLLDQSQHDQLVSEQQMGKEWAALHASHSYSKPGNGDHKMEDVQPFIEEYANIPRNNLVAVPTLLDDKAMGNNPTESNVEPAQNLREEWIAGIELKCKEAQETSISDGHAHYPVPTQPAPSAPENNASHFTSSTRQGLYQSIFPGVYATGNTFMTPKISQNISDDKKTSQEPTVTPSQSSSVAISPPSVKSFVTAEEDEVSMVRSGPSPEYIVTSEIESSNSAHNAKGAKTALGALPIAPLTNELSELHLASGNESLLDQQDFKRMSLISRETKQSHNDSLLASPVRTAEDEEALLEGSNMWMIDVADKSVALKLGFPALNKTSNMLSRIDQSHELPGTQLEPSTPTRRRSNKEVTEEYLPSPEAPDPNNNYSPTGTPRYFCKKCEKPYKKKMYLMKHEEKCCREDHQNPLMPSSMDFTSPNTEGSFSMPSLDSKLPSGNSYCTACDKEFTAVGRLRLHLEKACPVLRQAGIYDRVKERLRATQESKDIRAHGDQVPTSLRVQPKFSSVVTRNQSNKAGSEFNATSSFSPQEVSERKRSSNFTKPSLNIVNADNNRTTFKMDGIHRTSRSQSTLRRASTHDHQPAALVDEEVKGENASQRIEDLPAKPFGANDTALPTPLRPNQAPPADRTTTPALTLAAREGIKQLDSNKTPGYPTSDDEGSPLSGLDSDGASDDEQLPIGEHSIQGDDKDRILGYPERTRLFSDKIKGSSPSVNSPVDPFENILKSRKSTTTRRTSIRSGNVDPFAPTPAKTEIPGADKANSLIVSLADKTLCGIVYGKIEKGLLELGDDKPNGLMVWPLYEVSAAAASNFEFKVEAPEGFDLIATVRQIMPRLAFTHHRPKGWMAVLKTGPAAQTTSNVPANEHTHSSSDWALKAKTRGQSKQTTRGRSMPGVSSSRSRYLGNSSMQTGEESEDLIQVKRKRTSSRLSELNSKDKKDAAAASTKKRKLGK